MASEKRARRDRADGFLIVYDEANLRSALAEFLSLDVTNPKSPPQRRGPRPP
jgi:hypothetical protein